MPNVDNKKVREACNKMNDAWVEGAKSAVFNGIDQAAFQADIDAAAAADAEIAKWGKSRYARQSAHADA